MDISTAAQFSKVIGIKVEEVFGNCFIDIEPGSFCIFDRDKPSNSLHYHNCYELCLVTGGSGEFMHGGETYILNEGDVFITNPGVVHEIRIRRRNNSDYIENLYLVFFRMNVYANTDTQPELYEEKMLKEFLSGHFIISRSQKHLFSYLQFIDSYTELNSGANYGLHQVVKNMALESLFSLVNTDRENQLRKPVPSDTAVDRAMTYIGANLHRRIHLDEIAANVYTSERNLQYLFQKHMKKSITDYINLRKTAVAAGYLKMNFKVNDICGLVGINDAAQFSRLFKKYYGVSPKKYQMAYSPAGMVSGASYKSEMNT